MNAQDSRIVGVEVLSRWNHPEQGLLLPGTFVPLAEEVGLIGQMDAAVFAAACQRAAPWVAEG
uniref:EAL domain-containing protein n=1 Tax=Phenylobacterium glaciei TaxID=2803784 RepID=A0A974SAP2_9CAUL|nr:EAL domain-containing protein [Phenylobacterium glaciei]